MSRGLLAGLLVCAAACNVASGGPSREPSADDTSSAPVAPSQAVPAQLENCATPRTGDWRGIERFEHADVSWTFVKTRGCRDHYVPSGTAHHRGGDDCARAVRPASAPISVADGSMIVDRSTSPPTYRIAGKTRWDADDSCHMPRIVSVEWGNHEGVIEPP